MATHFERRPLHADAMVFRCAEVLSHAISSPSTSPDAIPPRNPPKWPVPSIRCGWTHSWSSAMGGSTSSTISGGSGASQLAGAREVGSLHNSFVPLAIVTDPADCNWATKVGSHLAGTMGDAIEPDLAKAPMLSAKRPWMICTTNRTRNGSSSARGFSSKRMGRKVAVRAATTPVRGDRHVPPAQVRRCYHSRAHCSLSRWPGANGRHNVPHGADLGT